MTIPEGQNWPRVKNNSNLVKTHSKPTFHKMHYDLPSTINQSAFSNCELLIKILTFLSRKTGIQVVKFRPFLTWALWRYNGGWQHPCRHGDEYRTDRAAGAGWCCCCPCSSGPSWWSSSSARSVGRDQLILTLHFNSKTKSEIDTIFYALRCYYNTVNFLKYSQKTPHSSPVRARYVVLLWVQHLIDILLQFL